MTTLRDLNDFQRYFVEEFVEDYKEGLMSRRDMMRRVLYIVGGVASTATMLSALGCTPQTPAPTATTAPKPAAPPSPAAGPPSSPAAAASPAVKAPAASPAASPAARPGASPGAQPSPTGPRSPLSVPENDPAVEGQFITFSSSGATIRAYQARPRNASGPLPLVLVCHENRGVVPHIRDVARRFAKHEGYIACAIDLLSRDGGTDRPDQAQIPALLSGADPNRHVADFQAAVDHYKSQPQLVRADRIGMTGYCIGGGITWRASTKIRDLKATAPYYGSNPPLEDVPAIQAAVFGVYAEQDTRVNQGIDTVRGALQQGGKTFEIKVYPGVGHAFHNDAGGSWNEQQATAAWRDTVAWFQRYLKA